MIKGATCMATFVLIYNKMILMKKKNLEENKSLPFHKESCSPPKRVVYCSTFQVWPQLN